MAISWKRLGRTVEIITLIAVVLAVIYLWKRFEDIPEPPAPTAQQPAPSTPSEADDGGRSAGLNIGFPAPDTPDPALAPEYPVTSVPVRNSPEPRSDDDSLWETYASPCPPAAQALPSTAVAASVDTTERSLVIATELPQHSSFAQRLIDASKDISARTSGRVTIKFRFSVLYRGADDLFRRIKVRQWQGALLPASDAARIYPDLALYQLPFMFRSPGEVAHVREDLDASLLDGLEEAGFVGTCIAGSGFSRLMSQEPIRSVVDLRGKRTWTPEGDPVLYGSYRLLGSSPVPLPVGDVFVGLQTGLMNVVPATPMGAIVMQWHTKLSHLTLLPLHYDYSLMVIDRKAFSRISHVDQLVVRSALDGVFRELDAASWRDEAEALEALADTGIAMIEPDLTWAAELQKLQTELAVKLIQSGDLSPELYNRAQALIEEYRAAN